jgi:hypothetical protein
MKENIMQNEKNKEGSQNSESGKQKLAQRHCQVRRTLTGLVNASASAIRLLTSLINNQFYFPISSIF